jgi:hypothetical protein
MAKAQAYTDPRDPLKREFVPANKVEETRFKAMGYKAVEEKKDNKQAPKPANK